MKLKFLDFFFFQASWSKPVSTHVSMQQYQRSYFTIRKFYLTPQNWEKVLVLLSTNTCISEEKVSLVCGTRGLILNIYFSWIFMTHFTVFRYINLKWFVWFPQYLHICLLLMYKQSLLTVLFCPYRQIFFLNCRNLILFFPHIAPWNFC